MKAFVALLLTAVLAVPACANDSDTIVIELGDTAVTRAEVDERFAIAVRLLARRQGVSLADQDPTLVANLREQFLDKYATELILLREAERRRLEISDSQVDAALGELFASDADKEAMLAEISIADTTKHDLLRQVVRDEKTIELLNEHMLKEIKISAGDVITMHHDVKHALATPEEVCVRHIQTTSVEAANEILADLKQGASVEELARERSTDAASAATGGDIGCFERSHAAARSEFEKAAFAAQEGELTGPVESQFGYHILVVYEHNMPREPTLNEAYVQIERELALDELPQRIQSLVSNSGIRIYPDKFQVAAD